MDICAKRSDEPPKVIQNNEFPYVLVQTKKKYKKKTKPTMTIEKAKVVLEFH